MPSEKELRERSLKIIEVLRQSTLGMVQPAATQIIDQFGRNPYLILVSCVLSLRTKDTVSLPASLRLFQFAQTPQELCALPTATIEQLIYPVGFYRRKTVQLLDMSRTLLEKFDGQVPHTERELLSLKGVGRKTANLVLAEAFDIPAICVDVHVHRISNRLGLVKTKTPDETEIALKKFLPKEYWREWNYLLVMWGQNICLPTSPLCSRCPIANLCPRVGVKRSR